MRERTLLLALCVLSVATAGVAVRAAEPPAAQPASPAAETQATTPKITPGQLQQRLEAGDPDIAVLDVRTAEEFAAGHVPGARNIPHDQVAARLAELASWRDKQVVLYCRSGRRSGLAADVLRKAGFARLLHLEGDYPGWEASVSSADRAQ